MESNTTFLGLIKKSILSHWDMPAFTDYGGKTLKFREFAKNIAELHILFETMNIEKGDKIAICGRNCTNWAITFFASTTYGAIPTTILHDFDGESIQNIVNHCDAKVFFVNEHAWEKVDPEKIPHVGTIIFMDDFSIIKTKTQKLNHKRAEMDFIFQQKYPNGFTQKDILFHQEEAEELALINYTSGTTSQPKGVMLPYRSLWSNTQFAIDKLPFVKAGDTLVSMLPMAHMYGLAFEILLSVAKGCHVYFLTRLPSPQIIMDAFLKVNPTLVIAVPLIIEKIIAGKVFPLLKRQPSKTFLKLPFAKKIIYNKIRQKILSIFGSNLVEVVIGGAAIDHEVAKFLTKINFPYTIGYGMTECGPLVSYDFWDTFRITSCGKAVDRMQVKIDSANPETEVGEILVKGTNLMLGYYKNQEATNEVFDKDGWLKTGDLGLIDKDSYIYIKGRSKTMILGSSGQNIYPEEMEQLLNNMPHIAESLLVERDKKIHALIYPDLDAFKNNNTSQHINDIINKEVNAINKRLPRYCQITSFNVQNNEFDKTPKRSIKRFLYK